ncbi:hypothetical protein ACIA59_10740 [Micromonospora haikouensis]|uniref:hypothetical protein n=1 Tax=Micromonospora haikouensis TaxID=686309 RepID=UPI0037B11A4C
MTYVGWRVGDLSGWHRDDATHRRAAAGSGPPCRSRPARPTGTAEEALVSDPIPPARPVPDGRPPLADGQTIPHPPRPASPPVTRRQQLCALLVVALVLAAALIGMLR